MANMSDKDRAGPNAQEGPVSPGSTPTRHPDEAVTAEPGASEPAPSEPGPSEPIPRAISTHRLVAILAGVALALYLGSLVGPPVGAGLHQMWTAVAGSEQEGKSGGGHQYYTCGMHPWVIVPHPGNCPICGMKLVPLDPAKFSGEVTIDPVVSQNIGVRVEKVQEGSESGSIRTVGTVTYDETLLGDVNVKVSGWIEKLYVDYLGAPVRRGQPLFELYSPELYAAQGEYLLAYKATKRAASGDGKALKRFSSELLEPARTKLELYDIGGGQIKALQARGKPKKTMTVVSPQNGVVTEKHAFEGMNVTPGMTAFRIADLSRVWVMATLYEYQSRAIEVGQPATMTLTYLPGKKFEGKVVYIYPFLDEKTRQIKVRLEFPNPDLDLKPGMYATVVFEGTQSDRRVLVPRSSVIDTGERQVAFVALGEGRFEPRKVSMGAETEELEKAKQKAEDSDHLKSSFLANMSHEIRTPMNAILGFSSLLKDNEFSKAEKDTFIRAINSNGEALMVLIDDILDISMIESNQLTFNSQYFDVNEILIELEEFYRLKNENKLIIEFVNRKDKELILHIDPVRFRQIMNNLLSNALKYTEVGFIRFGYEKGKNEIRFFVSDSGIGIDPAHSESIFEHFYKIELHSNKLYSGTGIGLAICKQLVELLNGKIWLESKPGSGSNFYFTLPNETNSDTALTVKKRKQSKPTHFLDNIFFVIAEDETANYQVLVKMLHIPDDRHFWGKNGKEVVDYIGKLESHNDLLVLMDIKMPVMNGNEALKQIKKINKKIPVIAVTAFALKQEEKEFMEQGFDDYLAKPIKANKLKEIIKRFFGNKVK